ncbi:bifunctional 4-hydroxy-2-oxoglutarate aldolase/2-dehydro-3-deoxy-phosphogluconate aldolase [Microbacterium hatanonis]|uniref:Bifunctional 4-hydroxy-2-oxoglutarate aldolase/2-dehydro-3-deoxy-phosphogluconate aldolase n=1 Tax=Microbacterium hatanonis TaxID=404366 RepID=A0A5C8I1N3_9MICO|nr:bifunctional 4-hydroxy-2-oxoglutarate aldolase/2-dehydro-3-deoxy-phosphogluconate aldolase [Microbacterium hatanonis]TXK12111.1 bifunctional 4-hydroxy-2-oxoglutarate aldolase/2-dehydro-3-deoxy-phosphogluconate aldolase [Microbacterium hatanonis]
MTGDTAVRLALPARTRDTRLIVVVRAPSADDYDGVIEALLDAGVQSVELTLTTPGTIERLAGLVDRYGDGIDLGVGTVVDADQLSRAVDAGARYLVTPVTSASLVAQATAAGVPIVPGGLTPTELFASWSAGASAVKVFPAGQVSPDYVKDLRGPFPGIDVVPSGGVDLTGAEAWLRAGAVAVSVGGPLLGDALRGGDRAALRARADAFVEVCARATP